MVFDISNSEFAIRDVLRISRQKGIPSGKCRGDSLTYLSCRLSGSSEIDVNGKVYRPDADNVLLCPSKTKYIHHYSDEELIAVHLEFSQNPPKEIELIYYPSPEVREAFIKLYKHWSMKQPGYISKCKSIVYNIFYLLYSASFQDEDLKIKASMDYLYKNYLNCDFDIPSMISRSYISQAYFRRIFRKIYGCTIVEFVTGLRIEHAKSLIQSKQYSIKEVAAMSGFRDEKYFSQIFRKTCGCVPGKYN